MRAKPVIAPESTSTPGQTPTTIVSAATVSPTSASDQTWSGELILVRSGQLIARKADGTERVIYSVPSGSSINSASTLADSKVIVELSTGTQNIYLVDLKTGKASIPAAGIVSGILATPRPTTDGIVVAVFSNDERNFGTSINLTEVGKTKTLYKSKDTVTSLAWSADGEALAIGTQTGVVVVNMTTGESAPYTLSVPVRSLGWSGASVLAVTSNGSVTQILPGKSSATLSGFSSIGRDFIQVATDQYIWLHDSSGQSAVEFQKTSAKAKSLAQAARILGVLND